METLELSGNYGSGGIQDDWHEAEAGSYEARETRKYHREVLGMTASDSKR